MWTLSVKHSHTTHPLTTANTGRLLHIHGGDTISIVEDETGVHLKTLDQVIAEAQAYFASFVPRGISLGDEINAERRSEVERDS